MTNRDGPRVLDSFGWFIWTMHQLLGHQKASVAIGVDPGDEEECTLCLFDRGEADIYDVIRALSGR